MSQVFVGDSRSADPHATWDGVGRTGERPVLTRFMWLTPKTVILVSFVCFLDLDIHKLQKNAIHNRHFLFFHIGYLLFLLQNFFL